MEAQEYWCENSVGVCVARRVCVILYSLNVNHISEPATLLVRMRFACGGKWRVFDVQGECYQLPQTVIGLTLSTGF